MTSSKHLVDPQLRPVLDTLRAMTFSTESLPALRAGLAEKLAAAKPADLPVTMDVLAAPGPRDAPDVRVLSYRPTAVTGVAPALLQIHGGGFVIGSAGMNDAANRALAAALGCAIFAVDYRLSPETPFPGALEDCYAALAWLYREAATLRIDPARIGVKGESAGGGLAASLALLARDRGEFPLAFQHLIHPMIDDRTGVAGEPHPFAGEFVWTRDHIAFGWTALLGEAPGGAGVSPYAAASRATDLAGLAPAYIAIGALDLLMEEGVEYGRRLGRAGVPVEMHVYPGAFHGFFSAAPGAEVSIAAERNSREALHRAFHGPAVRPSASLDTKSQSAAVARGMIRAPRGPSSKQRGSL